MTTVNIEIRNLDKVKANLRTVSEALPEYVRGANMEASREILDTDGLRKYPPATDANQPPPPYYIRGRGTQVSYSKNLLNSERYGTKWKTTPYGKFGMKIANPVSYAQYLGGENQARHMGAKGWRKLFEVAKEKVGEISEIYNKWLARLIKDKGL